MRRGLSVFVVLTLLISTAAAARVRPPAIPDYVPTVEDAYCYDKYEGRMERWAIDYMCSDIVNKGSTDVWLMELVDHACRTAGKVTVTIENGAPLATSTAGPGSVCATINHWVTVDANQCALFFAPSPIACHGYIDDRSKIAKTHTILTLHEPTMRYKVQLKADCTTLEAPVFKSWFASAMLLRGRPCDKAWGGAANGVPPGKAWMLHCCQKP